MSIILCMLTHHEGARSIHYKVATSSFSSYLAKRSNFIIHCPIIPQLRVPRITTADQSMNGRFSQLIALTVLFAAAVAADPVAADAAGDAAGDTRKLQSDECLDTNPSCLFWAQNGECGRNPAYMTSACAKSCNACESVDETAAPTRRPTRSGPAGPPDISCVDSNDACEFWASMGECGANPTYMNEFCTRSCNGCGGSSGPSEPTRRPTRRPTRKPTRKPTRQPTRKPTKAKPTRKPTRKPTGNKPTEGSGDTAAAPCFDRNEGCEFWASNGECGRNPTYMDDYCPKACNGCDSSGSAPPPPPTKQPTMPPRPRPQPQPVPVSRPVIDTASCRTIYFPSISDVTFNYFDNACTYSGHVANMLGDVSRISSNNPIDTSSTSKFQSAEAINFDPAAAGGFFRQDVAKYIIVGTLNYCTCKAIQSGCRFEKVCATNTRTQGTVPKTDQNPDIKYWLDNASTTVARGGHNIHLENIYKLSNGGTSGSINNPLQASVLLDYAKRLPRNLDRCLILC